MSVWREEWLQASRSVSELINPLAFFVMMSGLFPMAVDVDPSVLVSIAPGVLWMAILLAIMIDLPQLFNGDYQDGTIEQWLIGRESVTKRVFIRLFVRWIFLIVPILLSFPLIGQLYGLGWQQIFCFNLSVFVGSPSVMVLGALISSLLLSARQASVMLAVLLLPLCVPILIFAVNFSSGHVLSLSGLWLLLAVLMLSLSVVPITIAKVFWLVV